MGLKHEARRRAIAAEVPVLPGSELVETLEEAIEQANSVGFPVSFLSICGMNPILTASNPQIMLKGTSGGGGMGMEIVKRESELREVYQRTVDMSKVHCLCSYYVILGCY